jgi:hypothetical protein
MRLRLFAACMFGTGFKKSYFGEIIQQSLQMINNP